MRLQKQQRRVSLGVAIAQRWGAGRALLWPLARLTAAAAAERAAVSSCSRGC